MLVICLKTDDIETFLLAQERADVVEIRLDLLPSLEGLSLLCAKRQKPLLFTVANKLHLLKQVLHLKPEYIDLDSHTPLSFVEQVAKEHPEIQIISSHHDYEGTPDLDNLKWGFKAGIYKCVTTARSSLDTLRILEWGRNRPSTSAFCMGELGEVSRVLSPLIRSPFTYTCLPGAFTASGQVDVHTLQNTYRFASLNPSSALFALIGDPVAQSPSSITHNSLLAHLGEDAVYVKIPLLAKELKGFAPYLNALPFAGLSITIPHKEKALFLADRLEPGAAAIGAINTLYRKEGEWVGANTDGIGAVRALERKISLEGKRILVLGSGGTARSIVYECIRRGAHLFVWGRTPEKAGRICADFGACQVKTLKAEPFDVLINATSLGMAPHLEESPFPEALFCKETLVMDVIAYPKATRFLREAQAAGCEIIEGVEMFIFQAVEQFLRFQQKETSAHEIEQRLRWALESLEG